MTRQVYVVEQHKDRSGWAIIFLAAIMIAFYKWILLAVIFALILGAVYCLHKVRKDYKAFKVSENAAIAARADHQHRLAMADDPLGIEGDYPCTTMPVTHQMVMPIFEWQDDINDGLEEWK